MNIDRQIDSYSQRKKEYILNVRNRIKKDIKVLIENNLEMYFEAINYGAGNEIK